MNNDINSILDIFEETVDKCGDRIAVVDPSSSINYEEFLKKVKLAGSQILKKISKDIKEEEVGYPIAILADKGIDNLSAMLGSVYAGGFYVSVNPEQPLDRIKKILSVLSPKLFIVEEKYMERVATLQNEVRMCTLEEIYSDKEVDEDSLFSKRKYIKRDNPLYGIFTSGSTGVPKCVLVPEGAVIDFISHFTKTFSFTKEDIIGNQAPFDFDVSIKDIFSALFTGASLVLIPREYFSTPAVLIDYLIDNKVTNLTWAVSALCIISGLKGFSYKVPKDIKRVMFSGEVMPIKQLNIWRENIPNAKYVNLYGPSEITCNCNYYVIDREFEKGERLPLGKVFDGRKVLLLDENDNIIKEEGKTGEICVLGESIAIGYYNNEEETKKHFVEYTYEGKKQRMYKTGDVAIYENGEMYFSGRKDFQIKHMGHRIELEEIERGIDKIDRVYRSICTYDEKRSRITAYYRGDIDKKDLHIFLKEEFPLYMVPNKFVHIKEFILNKNGKIDRKQLLNLEVVE